MQEKNKASEMLSQMRKYIHGASTEETDSTISAEPESATPVTSSAEQERQEVKPISVPPAPKKEKARTLPVDEALFEFDEIAFDDVLVPEPPVLTPEEAEYADELREKFGVSTNVGIAFINEEPTENEKAFAPPIEVEEATESESEEAIEPVAEEVVSEPEVEEEISFEPEVEEEITLESEVVTESEVEEEISFESEVEEITVIPTEGDEPEQVVFGGIDDFAFEPEPKAEPIRSDAPTSSGVQITFLDATDDYYDEDEEPEQIVFEAESENEDLPEESDENSVEEEAVVELEVLDNTEPVSDITEEEIALEAVSESEQDYANEVEALPEHKLTELEKIAIEEEAEKARVDAETRASARDEDEKIKARSYATDVWDDADRRLYNAKKKYMEYCDGLAVPPMREGKEQTVAVASEKIASSGYRYETTERLPLFTDGINGGKNTDGYRNREMQFCAERENKRSAQLLERMRVSGKKVMFAAIIMLAIVIIENIGFFFAGNPDGLLAKTGPMLFGIIEAMLLTVGAALIFDALRDGIKCAIKGVFILEVLSAIVTIPTVIYHVVIAFVGRSSAYTMLFGSAAAIAIFLTALYRYFAIKRYYTAFTVTASYGQYLTDAKLSGFKNTPEGRVFGGYTDEESSLYRMNRVSRIDAPYVDKAVRDECFGLIRKLLLCIISVAVISGVVFGILRHDAIYGALSFLSLIAFASPVSAFLAVSLPRMRAASLAAEQGGAIVELDDEGDEYADSVIMIDDGELFPADKLISSNFEIYSARVEAHLARTLALFKKIGGPIAVVFNNVEGTFDNFESIRITEITEHGIQAKIDGRPICAGNESFMKRMGIKISRYDKLLPKNGRVMYIADDGVFFARLILIFKPDEELVQKIADLRNTSTVFSLKTCNPCIDSELLFYTTGLEPDLLRLVKYESGDDTGCADTDREGGLVSSSGAKGLLTALFEYKRQRALVRDASVFACAACGIGAFVSLLTSVIRINFGFTSLLVLGLQGALSLVAFALSRRRVIDTKTKIKKK